MEILSSLLHSPSHTGNTFTILLILMAVIWTTGRMFSKLKLPPVLGEILAGILLGPALLDIVHETESLKTLAELGVFFIMFHAGLEADPKELKKSSRASIAIATGGVVTLFSVGSFVMWLFDYSVLTSLFMGAVLAVTSFPIIARVLKDLKLTKTKIGSTILCSTIVDDILAFILVSIIIAIVSSGEFSWLTLSLVVAKVVFFFLGTMFLGFKILPYFRYFLNKSGTKGFTFSLVIAMMFAVFAEFIGLHMILGAYLGGMFVRQEIRNEKMFHKLEDRYFGIGHSFLGPIFFASVGIAMSFEVFDSSPVLILSLLAVVFLGQWFGSGLMAYFFSNFTLRESSAVALALSGRGVMEIILAKVGYETIVVAADGSTFRVLSQDLFSTVVIIAVVTTFAAPFLLRWVLPKKYLQQNTETKSKTGKKK